MSAVTTQFGTLDTVESLAAPAAPRPHIDLLAKWFDTTQPLTERKAARRLFFGSLCERGSHRPGAPIVGSARSGLGNEMAGEPTYYKVGPRRACDLQGSGRIYEYTLRQEEYELLGESRLGYVVDVFDLGLNAAGETRHIGTVRQDGRPFTNPQFAYQATIGAGGWLHQYWQRDADTFTASEAGALHRALMEDHARRRDEAQRTNIAQQAEKINGYIELAKLAATQHEFDQVKAEVDREKRVLEELKAAYERRPIERTREGDVF